MCIRYSNWTEVIMQNIKDWHTNAISLHYYTVPTGDWGHKGAATEFSDEEYYETISKTLYMEELIDGHSRIMDKYDKEKKIGLIVDEWGCWYDVEKGTNPGFLYQQNTMRDAVVAAVNLNIFNSRSDRVVMANLAQAVNVLQALILTEGEKMVKTPTYHVFDLYKNHQGGKYVYTYVENETAGEKIPMISASASVKDGVLTLTAANCSIDDETQVTVDIRGMNITSAECEILTNDVRAYNDFYEPEKVKTAPHSAAVNNGVLTLTLPACSVAAVTLR